MEDYLDRQEKENIIILMIHEYLIKIMESGQISRVNVKVITLHLEDFIIQ